MLQLIGIERPPLQVDRQPDTEPFASVKFAGKVGDFVRLEVTAHVNQGLTDDMLVSDAQRLIREAVAVLNEALEHWPEPGPASPPG
jgi:hypothetical protein